MKSTLRSVWHRRDLVFELVRSELRSTSAESRLGWLWWLLDPLLLMLVYWLCVAVLLGRGAYDAYPVFVSAALLPWQFAVLSLARGARLLRANEALVKAVPFPLLVLPVALVFAQFVLFTFSLGALAALCGVLGHSLTATVLQAVPLALLQLVLVAGLVFLVAPAAVLVRDLEGFLTHGLRIVWYLSPGIYGVALLEERLLQWWPQSKIATWMVVYRTNPFALLFEGYRAAFYQPTWIDSRVWAALAGEALAIFALGCWFFHRLDRRLMKYL